MPKKALVRAMQVWDTVNEAAHFGIHINNKQLNWQEVMSRKNKLIDKFVGGKEPYLKKQGVDLAYGTARFVSPDSIDVAGKTYTADRFLIGTGSKPNVPPIEGIEHAKTNRDVLYLDKLPKSMVFIGGGVISLEFAHVFNSAGVDVTILQRSDVLLSTQDTEVSNEIENISMEKGITIIKNIDIEKIEKQSNDYVVQTKKNHSGNEQFKAEMVIVAAGRVPDVEELNLQSANINYSNRGIEVNELLQTNNERVYAAGDCIGGLMLTPVAAYEAKLAIRNACKKGNSEKVDYDVIPHAVFTSPPVSSVGLTEEKAKANGVDYQVCKVPFAHSGTALLLGEDKGFMKLIHEKHSGKILGFHCVGIHADELVHEIAIAMRAGFRVQDLAEVVQVHPTISETLIELAMQAAKDRL